MKFKIRETAPPVEKEQVVEVGLCHLATHVRLEADGEVLLWVEPDGTIDMAAYIKSCGSREKLEGMGFVFGDDNTIKVT